MKKINQPTPDVNPSTQKARRRNLVLDAVARRITGAQSWSAVGSAFTGEILPVNVVPGDLTEKNVRQKIRSILEGFLENLDFLDKDDPANKKIASDVTTILEDAPRKKRGKA